MTRKSNRRRNWLFWTVGLATLAASVAGGTYLRHTVTVRSVEVTGTAQSDPELLANLAAPDSSALMYDVDPRRVRDAVTTDPWVEDASITRWPTGVLLVQVTERRPVAMAVTSTGEMAYYLDRSGYPMPLLAHRVYDLPLVRGLPARVDMAEPVVRRGLAGLLQALDRAPPAVNALVSEILVESGDITLLTSPTPEGRVIPVRMGVEGDHDDRLKRLYAFWHQAILTQPDKMFRVVDLRFDGQVVTRER
jgi:cell division protein FtsQ